ncbi:MAG: leucine-rich repeat domain-containing protein [Verrucomicrobiota bacterium]
MKTTNALFGIFTLTLALSAQLQAQFAYNNNGDGTCSITGYTGAGGSVAIPTSINGLTVSAIGDGAFDNSTSLTNVTIPGSVRDIGNSAFYYCYNLANVTLGSGVTNIEDNAFAGTALGSVTVPNSVSNIGDGVFYSCYSLTNATLGNSITSIGDNEFGNCASLTGITIPTNVTSIGYAAFEGCTSLTSVTIPNTVTNFGDYALSGCTSLASVTIGNGLVNLGNSVFAQCTSLTSVTIGINVTSIGDSAFAQCTSLISIYFSGDAPTASGNAFESDADATAYYLAGASGWSNTLAGIPVALSIPGSLQVTIAPSGATAAGAQWQVDGGTLQNNGATVSGLSVGSHAVSFSTVNGWTTPANQTVSVSSNSVATATGVYVAITANTPTGSLEVTISPDEAITNGAQWQVDGGTLQNSGVTLSGLSVGYHFVSFTTISGWTTPGSRVVSVSTNSTATATGDYIAIPHIGLLHTATTLSIALTATIQLPDKTRSADTNITTSAAKEVSFTSKDILKLLETSLGSPFPSGVHLARVGGIVEALNETGYRTNLSAYISIDNPPGAAVVWGVTNSATDTQTGSGKVFTMVRFADGKGNAFILYGLTKETIILDAENADGDQTEIGSFSGALVGYGTLVDSEGNTDTAVFSGTISGSGEGPVIPTGIALPAPPLSVTVTGGVVPPLLPRPVILQLTNRPPYALPPPVLIMQTPVIALTNSPTPPPLPVPIMQAPVIPLTN